MGVHQYEIPGVIELESGAREAVVIHLYLKGLQKGDTVTYRGSMFAESAEWEWYNWGGTGLCQPQITANWWPRVFFRCACGGQHAREHVLALHCKTAPLLLPRAALLADVWSPHLAEASTLGATLNSLFQQPVCPGSAHGRALQRVHGRAGHDACGLLQGGGAAGARARLPRVQGGHV